MKKLSASTYTHVLLRFLATLIIACSAGFVETFAQQMGGNQIDTSFGRDGRVVTPFDPANPTGQNNVARLAIVQPDGKILAVGIGHYNDGRGSGAAVIRYLPDGQVDASYGNQGRALLFPSLYNNDGLAAALQPDGRLVVAGTYFKPETFTTAWAVARLTADGQPDATFGTGGLTVLDITPGSEAPLALRVEADGKILAAGSAADASRSFALARFNPDGQPDTTFAPSGFRLSTFFGPSGVVTKALFLSDGRVAVAGPVNTGSGDDIGLARYLSDGNPDPGSVKSITDSLNSYQDVVGGIAEGAGGKLVVCGWVTLPPGVQGSNSSGDMTVVRYNADGTLDQTFGAGGKVITDIIGGLDYARAALVQADGKIVAAGDSANPYGADIDFTLVRYNVDGSLDSGFGANGKVRTDVGTADGVAGTGDMGYGAVSQPDGRIIVTGSIVVVPRQRHDFGLVRYHGGPATEPPPPPAAALSSLTLSPTSVVGGTSSQGTVTLTAAAPPEGAVVTLSTSNAAATVPASVTVPAGATSAGFSVTTSAVTATTPVTVSASHGGITRTATLTINPQPAPATDAVAIQRAEYTVSKRQLRVEATSTKAGAVLRVYVTSTNQLIGTLTKTGSKYSGQFSWPANPQNVTVRSSLGGSASRVVSAK